jgi:hypothetical protein
MKWTIEFIESSNYFKVIDEGVYHAEDSVKLLAEIFSSEFWQPGMSILFDNRLVDFGSINYQGMSATSVTFSINNNQIGKSRIASLVASPIGFGISRQFQTLMAEKSPATVEIFTDEEKAVEWLTAKQAASE